MRVPTACVLFALIPTICPSSLMAQDGTLDPTFNGNGLFRLDLDMRNDRALGIAIAANGDIIASGTTSGAAGSDVLLLRLANDGTLVPGFGDNGVVRTSFGPFDFASGRAVVIDQNDRIVVAGQFAESTNNDEFVVLRYHADGTLDGDFGAQGRTITSFAITSDAANAVALQPDGKILAAGFAPTGFALARYLENGDPDSTFNDDGKVITSFGVNGAVARAVVLQPDGRILTAGYAPGQGTDPALARYESDGSLDTTFGDHGKVITSLGAYNDVLNALALLPDGRIYAAGTAHTFTDMFALLRYMPNGALDTTFDHDGIVTLPVGPGPSKANSMVLRPDGDVILSGSFETVLGVDIALARFDSTGAFDPTFGFGGVTFTDIDGRDDAAMASALQQDGKLVVAGYSADTLYDIALARYFASSDIGIAEPNAAPAHALLHPNPFDGATALHYWLDRPATVSIRVLDALGRTVSVPAEAGKRAAGVHDEPLMLPPHLPTGSYLVQLTTGDASIMVRGIKQ